MYLLHHLVTRHANLRSRPAIVDGDQTYSYADLDAAINTLAAKLARAGVGRCDRVCIYLPKSFAECAAMFAPSRLGATVVPINAVLKPPQVAHIVQDCGAKAVVKMRGEAQRIETGLSGIAAPPNIVFADDAYEQDESEVANGAGVIADDLAAILYTSGSTGLPKGVMLSHSNLLAGTRIAGSYLSLSENDRILSLLPFSFDYGLNQLLTSVQHAATLVLIEFCLGDEIVDALARHEITGLAGVPTVWTILAKAAPSLAKTNLPHLRYITNSGGALPPATLTRLRELLPETEIYLMYGLTEAFRSTYLPPNEVEQRPTSIGKAIPETDVLVIKDDGTLAAPGEEGTLVHRGPTVALGYWKRPEDTARVFRDNPFKQLGEGADTVCFSGDIVTRDTDGYFYFVARDDQMIKSAGFRISPAEIEHVLIGTGAFTEVAVIGLPDDWVGQKVVAVAVAENSDIDTKTVLQKVSEVLPAHMVPARIELVDKLPTTANGKVDYKSLVAERIP